MDALEACMQGMLVLSLILNIAVLVPVSTGLLLDASWVVAGYGDRSPARGILLSIYLAILAVSAWLLVERSPELVAPLLLVQVVYKVTTPATVGSLANPVVISNLLVAAVHLVTLALIARHRAQARAQASIT
jgi:uncharacterized membrane protein (DUF441 family)